MPALRQRWLSRSRRVAVCASALASTNADLHPYGSAAHAINLLEGFESLNVSGNFLPPPGSLGPEFVQYVFLLIDHRTGRTIETLPMVQLPGGDDWSGSFSPGVKTIPRGSVEVRPAPAGTDPSVLGAAVLRGDLRRCR